jgi:N-acetylmuramoyl-L-alanine amidase
MVEVNRIFGNLLSYPRRSETGGASGYGGVLGDSRTAIGARQGALTGSIFSRVPVVTVEMAVLTDAGDARFIASPSGQRRMAHAIAAGIARVVPHAVSPSS